MRTTDKEGNQARILSFIRDEIRAKGYPPSVREICGAVGFRSTSTVHSYLSELEKNGLIKRDAAKPRALELTDNSMSYGRTVPLVGKVTAGVPILAQENIEDELMLPANFVGRDEAFALRVEGESMIDAGILDGDIILVRKQQNAENGQIVVAMIDDEATVKRIFYEKDRVRLQPENPTMKPIYAKEVTVIGLVMGLFRSFR